MAEKRSEKSNAFSRIRNRDDAIQIATECATGFFAVAAIQGLVSIWLGPEGLIDAAAFAVCGYFVRKSFSRLAAVVALVLSLTTVGATILNMSGASVGGRNVILALIVVFVAVRSVEATFKIQAGKGSSLDMAHLLAQKG